MMKIAIHLPLPVMKALHKLGSDICDARRRRRISMQLMAERTNLSRGTLGKIERGDSTVSMGGYAVVLFVLGMSHRLQDLVDIAHDLTGQRLEAEQLPKRVRYKKSH